MLGIKIRVKPQQKKWYIIIPPGTGFLACGDIGVGRLADVDAIVKQVESVLK